jgi:hypothetical protein
MLLKLPVITTLKLFQEFTGEVVWTDLRLHHFVPVGSAWDSVLSYSVAVENLVSIACLVFGPHMESHFGDPLRRLLQRARCLPQLTTTPLYVPFVLNNVLRTVWTTFRHPAHDPSTGGLLILKDLHWSPLWAAQLAAVTIDYQSVMRFRDEALQSQLLVGPTVKPASVPKRSASPTPPQSNDKRSKKVKPVATPSVPSSKSSSKLSANLPTNVCISHLLYDTKLQSSPCSYGDECTYSHQPSTISKASILSTVSGSRGKAFTRDPKLRSRLIKAVQDGAVGTA